MDALDDRSLKAHAVQIAIIVAVVVVIAVGLMTYVAIHCINRGGSFDGGLSVSKNGLKVLEYKLNFRCTQ